MISCVSPDHGSEFNFQGERAGHKDELDAVKTSSSPSNIVFVAAERYVSIAGHKSHSNAVQTFLTVKIIAFSGLNIDFIGYFYICDIFGFVSIP